VSGSSSGFSGGNNRPAAPEELSKRRNTTAANAHRMAGRHLKNDSLNCERFSKNIRLKTYCSILSWRLVTRRATDGEPEPLDFGAVAKVLCEPIAILRAGLIFLPEAIPAWSDA